jgi:hypothetical protein
VGALRHSVRGARGPGRRRGRGLARLREASELAARDPKAAVAFYDDIAANSATRQPLKDFAAVRAATLLVDSAPLAEINRRLEPISAAGAPFRHSARELLAFASWKAGDTTAMRKWTALIRADQDTPQALRQRVEVLLSLAGESGQG